MRRRAGNAVLLYSLCARTAGPTRTKGLLPLCEFVALFVGKGAYDDHDQINKPSDAQDPAGYQP